MRSSKRLLSAVTVVLLSMAGLESSFGATESLPIATTPRIAIDNFGRVNETYYRGAQPRGADYGSLAAIGVKTVINLTSHDADPSEARMVEQAGMNYLQIPMTTRRVPTKEQLATFLAAVNDPAMQPVYVHCVGGKHRTGVMTAVYRMMRDGWNASRAFAEMKQFKFGADFLHPEFKSFVYAYRPDVLPTPTDQVVTTN